MAEKVLSSEGFPCGQTPSTQGLSVPRCARIVSQPLSTMNLAMIAGTTAVYHLLQCLQLFQGHNNSGTLALHEAHAIDSISHIESSSVDRDCKHI